ADKLMVELVAGSFGDGVVRVIEPPRSAQVDDDGVDCIDDQCSDFAAVVSEEIDRLVIDGVAAGNVLHELDVGPIEGAVLALEEALEGAEVGLTVGRRGAGAWRRGGNDHVEDRVVAW